MCLKIEEPMSNKVKRIQSTFDVGDFKHPDKDVKVKFKDNLHQIKLVEGENPFVDKKVESDAIYIDENGVYQYIIPHCSHCKSRNVTKHDTNLTPIYSKDGKKEHVRVKKYKCKNCGKGSQVEFDGEFNKYSGLPHDLTNKIEKINSLHWISLRDIVKIIKITLGISISKEYVRKAELITDKLYWSNEEYNNAKYVNYDCQWIPVDEGWMYLHVLIDNSNRKVISMELTHDEEKETIKSFFQKSWKVPPKVMITDSKVGYHELIKDELKIEHQECLIHFKKSLNRKIKKEINKIKNKIKGSILFKNPNITDYALDSQTEELMEPIYDEYWSYKDKIMKSFDFDTFEESSDYIQSLRNEVKNWPEAICKYVTDQFLNIYRRFILYKHDDFKGKIPSNNNLSETKIGWGASKSEKRKYRTGLAFFNHLVSRIKYWG